jgi:hypothetical protein
MTDLIERTRLPLEPADVPNEDAYDARFLAVYRVVWACYLALETARTQFADPERPTPSLTQAYVDELHAAYETGMQLLDHDDAATFARDLSACDDELLRELRATVAYVAPHFDLEVDLPNPDENEVLE